jgi:dihydroxyacetone kinase-like predicted kinase
MGLLDGRLAGTGKTCGEAISPIVQRASAGPGNLVTLYYGSGVSKAEARAEAEALKSQFAGLEVEVVSGGQPYYPYLVSVE